MEIYKNMNKICTSIEQSQKLIELGIDVNTADMHYNKHSLENYYSPIPHIGKYSAMHNQIPCWSLSTLLDIIPNWTMDKTDKVNLTCNPYYHCEVGYNDSIDAAFEMVCWLKENGKI